MILLDTKISVPQLPARMVHRRRLLDGMNDTLERKLTLISAPAGSGKTTLLREWIASRGRRLRVAWLSLGKGENDPYMQREIADILALLAIPPGRLALAGLAVDWPRADVKDLQSALQGIRTSRINLRQQAYHALRDLTHGAYFADSATWSRLGYPGPAHVA